MGEGSQVLRHKTGLTLKDLPRPARLAKLRFLAAIAALSTDALFFAGDPGQRIFQPPFSWAVLGINVRGHCA